MIRLVTLDPLEPEVLAKLSRIVFQAYGLGCEHSGEIPAPDESRKNGALDADLVLKLASGIKSFSDDKLIYIAGKALVSRELPNGNAPTMGLAQYGGERAIVTTHGLPKGEALLKRLAKHVVHEIGHLWDLHHCLDPRCAMHPTWSPSFANGEPSLCTFCREKSERKIRMAKT